MLITKFMPIKKLGHVLKSTIGTLGKKRDKKSGVTPFQAVSTALAGTIGVGNIAGVSTAITLGGPGAIFWMWISAIFGMATKFAEVTLAVHFREKNKNGYIGGPMYYIEKGLGIKSLAVVFSVCCVLASFGIGNMTQSNAISSSLEASFGIDNAATGFTVAFIVALVIIGGIGRIVKVTEVVVPFMSILYIVGAVVVIFQNLPHLPQTFSAIFEGAFSPQSAVSGVAGYTVMQSIRYGIARGVFTNEAGLGSASIAHAAADTDSAVKQGFWGIFEVFFDTIIVCTMTAIVVISSGLYSSGLSGTELTQAAFVQSLGRYGGQLLSISIVFFALASILGWYYYGETAIRYLFRKKRAISVYRVMFVAMVIVGAISNLEVIFSISDTFNGLMAIPNLIAIIGLSGIVFKLTKQYFAKDKRQQ